MKKKKIIITGSSGFIGSHLTKWLSEEYDIIGIDKKKAKKQFRENTEFYHQDINDSLPDIKEVFAVIHLAGKAGLRDMNMDGYLDDNVRATKSILDKCEVWKPKKFIFTSSSSCYGEQFGYTNEGMDLNPQSLYAVSKATCEKLVGMYNKHRKYDSEFIVLRPFTVYGNGQRIGLSMRNFIDNALKGETLTIYGDGFQERDFIHIDKVCEAIEKLLEKSKVAGTYNLGEGFSFNLMEVIQMIAVILDKEVTLKFEKAHPYDVRKTLASTYALQEVIDWIPEKVSRKGEPIKDSYDILRKNLKEQISWQKSLI